MRRVFVFCALIAATLLPSSSFAKPKREVIEEDGLVIIRVKEKIGDKIHAKVYVYFVDEGRREFSIYNGTEDIFYITQATLDKNDKIQVITKMSAEGKKYKVTKYPKSDKNNATLYKEMEKEVEIFVKENGVKQILQKHKNKIPFSPTLKVPGK